LAYLGRQFGYECTCLDYSPVGCEKTRENFRMLGIRGYVYEGDLFDEELRVPRHDIVYSLGLIEHFGDLEEVVARHLRFLVPGGTLLLGAPNFLGVNKWFLERLAPELLDVVDLRAMDLDTWRPFESKLKLKPVFRGYVGGLEPCVFRARRPELRRRPLAKGVSALDVILHSRLRALRRFNSRRFSGYVMAVYRAP
jgi:SAM-dependent methyltransferase